MELKTIYKPNEVVEQYINSIPAILQATSGARSREELVSMILKAVFDDMTEGGYLILMTQVELEEIEEEKPLPDFLPPQQANNSAMLKMKPMQAQIEEPRMQLPPEALVKPEPAPARGMGIFKKKSK